jgi:hypothetical protein
VDESSSGEAPKPDKRKQKRMNLKTACYPFFLMALIPKPTRKIRPNTIIEPRIPETEVPVSTFGHSLTSPPGDSGSLGAFFSLKV